MPRYLVLAIAFALASCGGGSNETTTTTSNLKTFDAQESAPSQAQGKAAPASSAAALPQIAYIYRHGYRLAAGDVEGVQRRHVQRCDSLGAARCRIQSMVRSSEEGEFGSAALTLQVDARIARPFGDRLDAVVTGAGGSVGNRGIEAEDLSRQMVDTEARIRGKEALAARLLVLLQNRTGAVGELVEAERAYAQAQEEIDAARSWLGEMRQRVTMSRIDITYASVAPAGGGLWQPVRNSIATAGQLLGNSLAALITILLVLLPWLVLVAAALWLARRFGWERWRRRSPPVADPVEQGQDRPL